MNICIIKLWNPWLRPRYTRISVISTRVFVSVRCMFYLNHTFHLSIVFTHFQFILFPTFELTMQHHAFFCMKYWCSGKKNQKNLDHTWPVIEIVWWFINSSQSQMHVMTPNSWKSARLIGHWLLLLQAFLMQKVAQKCESEVRLASRQVKSC